MKCSTERNQKPNVQKSYIQENHTANHAMQTKIDIAIHHLTRGENQNKWEKKYIGPHQNPTPIDFINPIFARKGIGFGFVKPKLNY